MSNRKSRATLVAETIMMVEDALREKGIEAETIMMVEDALREKGIEIEAIPTTQTIGYPLTADSARSGKLKKGIKVYLDFQIVKFYPDSEES